MTLHLYLQPRSFRTWALWLYTQLLLYASTCISLRIFTLKSPPNKLSISSFHFLRKFSLSEWEHHHLLGFTNREYGCHFWLFYLPHCSTFPFIFKFCWFHLLNILRPFSSFHLFSSVQFSHSVMSDSLRPHELQHARPPYPSPTPRVYSDSCP